MKPSSNARELLWLLLAALAVGALASVAGWLLMVEHAAPETVEMATPAARKAREKRMRLSPSDGRRKRKTGRTAQFNVKIRADLKTKVVQASRDHRLFIAELVEQALTAYLATLERRIEATRWISGSCLSRCTVL